ncbi:MAG: hypothetical protein AB1717_06785 [Pseudomonadota bacterium]
MFKQKPKNPPLKVSLIGMSEKALQLFAMFLDGPVRGSCKVVDDGSHEAVIIDLDGVESPRLWLDMRRKFQGPVIVLSVTEKNLNHAFWVSKPVKDDVFLGAVTKVREALKNPPKQVAPSQEPSPRSGVGSAMQSPSAPKIETRPQPTEAVAESKTNTSPAAQLMSEEMDERSQNCCGQLEDAAYRSGDPSALFFDPNVTLLGVFRDAMRLTREGGIAKIERPGAHPIFVSAGRKFTSTPMPEAYLRAVCARNISDSPLSVNLIEIEPKDIGVSEDPRLRRLDNMLWKISLWSSRGRVPHGTSLSAPVRLRRWPNIPRLMTVPHGMRIAALWVTQPSGLLDTAQKLEIPYRFVFAFYCACQSFDLTEQLTASSPEPAIASGATAQPANQEKRGLFGRLLKKLGFG